MIESLDNKINIEILKIDENAIEMIIRGEKKNRRIGIIIDCTTNNQLDYSKIYKDIKKYKLEETKEYLKQNNIEYKKVIFMI